MTRWCQNEGVNIPSFTGASCSHSSRNRFPEHFHPIWNIFWTLSSRANSQKGERLLFYFSLYYVITSKCGWYLISYDQGRHGWYFWPTILFQIRSLCKDEMWNLIKVSAPVDKYSGSPTHCRQGPCLVDIYSRSQGRPFAFSQVTTSVKPFGQRWSDLHWEHIKTESILYHYINDTTYNICLKLELIVMVMMKLMRKAPPGDSDEHKKMPCTTSTWATATFATATSNKIVSRWYSGCTVTPGPMLPLKQQVSPTHIYTQTDTEIQKYTQHIGPPATISNVAYKRILRFSRWNFLLMRCIC